MTRTIGSLTVKRMLEKEVAKHKNARQCALAIGVDPRYLHMALSDEYFAPALLKHFGLVRVKEQRFRREEWNGQK